MSTSPLPLGHSEIEELLGAYALDAVDPDTAAIIEEHLEGCVRCSVEVGQHHEVTGLLANSGGAAPAALWGGIAEQLGGTTDQSWGRLAARLDAPGDDREIPSAGAGDGPPAVVPIGSAPRGRSRWAAVGAGLVAAAAAVLAVAFGLQVQHLHGQVNALQGAPQLSATERAALASPSTRKVPLASTDATGPGGTPATIVLTAAGTGFLVDDTGDGLAPLPDNRTYQLWGVVDGRTISLGLLGPRPGIVPFSVAGSAPVTEFAVTDEVAGGVVASVNRPIAVGALRV